MRTKVQFRWANPIALTLLAGVSASPVLAQSASSTDPYASQPSAVNVIAVVRDFKPWSNGSGHVDFERYGNSYIRYGLVADTLDADGKPIIKSLKGSDISTEFKDKSGRLINPAHYDQAKGDVAGKLTAKTDNQITSAESFKQWYRDVPGLNASKQVTMTLNRIANTNKYVFDSGADTPYASRGGFFPIDKDLFGDQGSSGHNFAFSTEIETEFVYEAASNPVFKFTGDDDVWVFIDNKLVIDVGGLHPKKEQYLDLSRLSWLADGNTYSLKVFHAERHTNASNFRIETTLKLKAVEPPATTALFD